MDVTMTHDRYTTQHTNGTLTHRMISRGDPDGDLKMWSRRKYSITTNCTLISLIRQSSWLLPWTLRAACTMTLSVWFSCMLIVRLVLWPENCHFCGQRNLTVFAFCELHVWITLSALAKASAMRVTIPLDLSTRAFIPLPRSFHSRRTPSLLTPSLVLFSQLSDALSKRHMMCVYFWQVHRVHQTVHHSSSVTLFPLTISFFYSAVNKIK